jgi:nitrate reductase / nitrite oxidoreductase, alpha subunit
MGGFVRSTWPEVSELIAAAHVHTIRKYAPDRVVGFSPIPAMSQVSYAAGTRSLSMIGGTILSFYDWYADMPVASPQVFGDQTDVPESRTTPTTPSSPTTGWRPRPARAARWRWAMGHVILTEFFRDRQVEYFTEYVKTYTDAPFLVTLRHGGDAYVPDRFLGAADLGDQAEGAAHKPVIQNAETGAAVAPNGALGFRYSDSGMGRWNPGLHGIDPVLTPHGRHDEAVPSTCPGSTPGIPRAGRGAPRRAGRAARLPVLGAAEALGRS